MKRDCLKTCNRYFLLNLYASTSCLFFTCDASTPLGWIFTPFNCHSNRLNALWFSRPELSNSWSWKSITTNLLVTQTPKSRCDTMNNWLPSCKLSLLSTPLGIPFVTSLWITCWLCEYDTNCLKHFTFEIKIIYPINIDGLSPPKRCRRHLWLANEKTLRVQSLPRRQNISNC